MEWASEQKQNQRRSRVKILELLMPGDKYIKCFLPHMSYMWCGTEQRLLRPSPRMKSDWSVGAHEEYDGHKSK